MNDYEPLEDQFCTKCNETLWWVDCYNCDEGYSYHDCGEDSCNCRYPENNVRCDICNGEQGWTRCLNSKCGKEVDELPPSSGEGKREA